MQNLLRKYQRFEKNRPYLSAIVETSIVIMIGFIGWYFATGKFKLPGLFIILGALLAELSEIHRRKK